MLLQQKMLGAPVAKLLAEKFADRRPPPMPDEGTRREAQAVAGIAQPPAEIHVIACGVEAPVEAADGVESQPGHGEIAARQMLGFLVIDQHVAGRAGGGADDCLLPSPGAGRQVRPAGSGEAPTGENRPQALDPLAVRFAIVICEGEHLAVGCCRTGVPRAAQPARLQADQAHPGEIFFHQIRGAVGGAVIDDECFEIAAGEMPDRVEATPDAVDAVAGADDDAEMEGVRSPWKGI